MNTGAHDAGGGFTSSVGANAARGIAVIAAAVIVGLLLMQYGLADNSTAEAVSSTGAATSSADDASDDADSADDAGAAADNSAATTAPTTTAAAPDTSAAPTAVVRDPSEVKVLALNAAVNKRGIAGRTTDVINSANFVSLKAGDAIKDQDTEIQYMETYEGSAAQIAELFGLDPDTYVVPFDPENSPFEDIGEAHVIVVIGFDDAIDL